MFLTALLNYLKPIYTNFPERYLFRMRQSVSPSTNNSTRLMCNEYWSSNWRLPISVIICSSFFDSATIPSNIIVSSSQWFKYSKGFSNKYSQWISMIRRQSSCYDRIPTLANVLFKCIGRCRWWLFVSAEVFKRHIIMRFIHVIFGERAGGPSGRFSFDILTNFFLHVADPLHFSLVVREYRNDTFPHRWIGRGRPISTRWTFFFRFGAMYNNLCVRH